MRRPRIAMPRIEIVREGSEEPPLPTTPIRTSADLAAILRPRLSGLEQEVFVALLLDAKHRLKPGGYRVISVGSLTASIVHPRETFRAAIVKAAAAVLLAHNHPSGDPSPSAEDMSLTRRLREAGELVGIHVLDHVIVGDGKHYSFVDAGAW